MRALYIKNERGHDISISELNAIAKLADYEPKAMAKLLSKLGYSYTMEDVRWWCEL